MSLLGQQHEALFKNLHQSSPRPTQTSTTEQKESAELLIGKTVLTASFGVGVIVNVEQMAGNRTFLVIESPQKNLKNFIPYEDFQSYRFLSQKEKLTTVLAQLESPYSAPDFDSKKDRIDYFKKQAKIQDLNNIVNTIQHLDQLTDRGSAESQIYKDLLEDLCLEHSLVHDIEIEKSRQIISEFLMN